MKTFDIVRFSLLALTLVLGVAAGCDDDGSGPTDTGHDAVDDSGHEHELEEHVCTHFQDGPFETVDAAADSGDSLEDVAIPHTAVTVELVAVTGGNGGWVSFSAGNDAEYAFFLTEDVPFAIYDAGDTEITIEHSETGSEACDEIAVQHHVELSVGTYKLSFGPTAETSVTMVSPELEAEYDHEH